MEVDVGCVRDHKSASFLVLTSHSKFIDELYYKHTIHMVRFVLVLINLLEQEVNELCHKVLYRIYIMLYLMVNVSLSIQCKK